MFLCDYEINHHHHHHHHPNDSPYPEKQQTPETQHVSSCRATDPPGPQVSQCPPAWASPSLFSVDLAEVVATSESYFTPVQLGVIYPHRISRPWTTGFLDDRNRPTLTRPLQSSPIRGLQPIEFILTSPKWLPLANPGHSRPVGPAPWHFPKENSIQPLRPLSCHQNLHNAPPRSPHQSNCYF